MWGNFRNLWLEGLPKCMILGLQTFFGIIRSLVLEDTLLEANCLLEVKPLLEANCLLEVESLIEANCLLEVKPFIDA